MKSHPISEAEEEEASDQEDANSDDDEDEDEDDDEDDGEDLDEEDAEDDEGDQDTEEYRSRRRGIGTTKRSSGFKDWARAALGIGGSAASAPKVAGADSAKADQAEEDDTAYNLEPVGGFKIKVGDLMDKDGVARGPLGRDEESAKERSAFAAKHYAELEAAVASQKAEQEAEASAQKLPPLPPLPPRKCSHT